MSYTIINDNNITHLKTIQDNTIDSIITDPPYGIEFLGKDWDKNTGAMATWQQCLRVLKPGGYLLAFSAARTYHNLATNIESVGFEIRDQLMWLYASGFPKAQDIGKSIDRRMGKENNLKRHDSDKKQNNGLDLGSGVRCPKCKKDSAARYDCKEQDCGMIYKAQTPQAQQWAGWKTALKPSHEPIVMARKPFKGSTIDNVLTHGVGALNIDASRIGTNDIMVSSQKYDTVYENFSPENRQNKDGVKDGKDNELWKQNKQGRFPSNVIGEVAEHYQKYFYCPKVSRRERHCGFEQQGPTQAEMLELMGGHYIDAPINQNVWLPRIGNIKIHGLKHEYEKWSRNKDPLLGKETLPNSGVKGDYFSNNISHNNPANKKDPLAHIPTNPEGIWDDGVQFQERKQAFGNVGNNHPTVKPVALMRYLIRLVTPLNSHVLDPFCGSGSTGMAAVELGHTFTGIELDANYVEIAKRRIEGWNRPQQTNNTYNELFEENK